MEVGFFSLITEDLPLVTSERAVKIISDKVTTAKMMVKPLREQSIVLGQTETPWILSSNEIRKSESTVADMINDLMREKFKVGCRSEQRRCIQRQQDI